MFGNAPVPAYDDLILLSVLVKLIVPVEPSIVAFVMVLFVNVSVLSCKTTVPDSFGKLTVLSAVGSITVKVVSKSSEVVPSNVNEFVTSIVVEFTVVVVPFTV